MSDRVHITNGGGDPWCGEKGKSVPIKDARGTPGLCWRCRKLVIAHDQELVWWLLHLVQSGHLTRPQANYLCSLRDE